MARSPARIDRRASPGRASGSAPSITVRRAAWRRRSLPPRLTAKRAMPMDSNELMLGGLLLLAALSIAAIVFLLINPYLSGEHRTDKRIQGVTENRAKRIAIKTQVEVASNRRRQVADTLKELEDRQKAREKVSLRLRLQRAGLDIQPRLFWLSSLVCGVLLGAAI